MRKISKKSSQAQEDQPARAARQVQTAPAPDQAAALLHLQHLVGNRAAQRILQTDQDSDLILSTSLQQFLQAGAGAPAGTAIQRSPLSEELQGLWEPGSSRAFFDRLRALTPVERADPDVGRWVNSSDRLGPDHRWLAQQILVHGPEPLWPADLLTARQQRVADGRLEPDQGGITATLSTQSQGATASTHAYFFQGVSSERALIIGGMHGSEMSAVQVAEMLVENLQAGRGVRPYFTVIIVPQLFPGNVAHAESEAATRPGSVNSPQNIGRYSQSNPLSTDPNRQFPAAGSAFEPGSPVDAQDRAIEPENVILLELIQRFQPSRVANLHAIRNQREAGVYADPRTSASGEALGFDFDRDLALAMAGRAESGGARVPGNRRSRRGNVNAIYPRDPAAAAAGEQQVRSSGGQEPHKKGTSFGTWGTTEISGAANPEANRPAMTVITVEVATAHRVEDMPRAAQAARLAELSAHSASLQEIFLGQPGTEDRPTLPQPAEGGAQ